MVPFFLQAGDFLLESPGRIGDEFKLRHVAQDHLPVKLPLDEPPGAVELLQHMIGVAKNFRKDPEFRFGRGSARRRRRRWGNNCGAIWMPSR